MKQLLLFFFISSFTIISCKKRDPDTTDPTTVSISGTIYPTVKIGTQIWTSVNYNGPGGENYANGPNEVKYGKLYSSAEAKSIVTPEGWRLPTKADFDKLLVGLNSQIQPTGETLLGKDGTAKLMSTSDWEHIQGNNQTGLNVYPAGVGASSVGKGLFTEFWSSSHEGEYEWVMSIQRDHLGEMKCMSTKTTKDWSRSIRFVMDN